MLQIVRDGWLVVLVIFAVSALTTKPTPLLRAVDTHRMLTMPLMGSAFLLMFVDRIPIAWLNHRVITSGLVAGAGVCVAFAGQGLTIWSRLILGSNWSGRLTVKHGHELVITGPYQWVRHPIYTGVIAAFLGTAMVLGEIRGFIAAVLLWAVYIARLRREEHAMASEFGENYAGYRSGTGALLPRL